MKILLLFHGIEIFNFELTTNGSQNGLEIIPTFTVYLEGNTEDEYASLTADTVYVSAYPRYNIKIKQNVALAYVGLFDLSTGNETDEETDTTVYGRMLGFGITLQLYNTSTDKGLKGIEIPTGNIEFDIVLDETDSSNTSNVLTDEDGYTPLIWDYKNNYYNNSSSSKGILKRELVWQTSSASYGYLCAPFSTNSSYRRDTDYVYYGGYYKMEQTDTATYHFTVYNYEFDTTEWHFPTADANISSGITTGYGDYIGCISAGYIEVLQAFPEDTEYDYITLTVEAENLEAESLSGVGVDGEETKTSDNSLELSYAASSEVLNGTLVFDSCYNGFARITSSGKTWLWSSWGLGDAAAGLEEEIYLLSGFLTTAETRYSS